MDTTDNAMCESFFMTRECGLLWRARWRTHAEARRDLFAYTEGFYTPCRLHWALGCRSPTPNERTQRPCLVQG